MNKKGFTLVELLAVFILLGIIAVIAFKVTDDIKEQSQIEALKASAKNIFTAADNYYADNDYKNFPSDGVMISELDLQGNSFTSGKVTLDSSGNFLLVDVSDGEYCINGDIDNLEIKNETCDGSSGNTNNSPLEGATKVYLLVIDDETNDIISPSNFPTEFNIDKEYGGLIAYIDSDERIIDVSNKYFFVARTTDAETVNTFKQSLQTAMESLPSPVEIHSYIAEDLGFSYIFISECGLNALGQGTMNETEYQNLCVNKLTISEIQGTTVTNEMLTSIGYTIINF